MSEETGSFRLPYVPSNTYKVAVTDSATIVLLRDNIGTTLQITFNRMDVSAEAELAPGTLKGGELQQKGPPEIVTEFRKIQEFAALMRPDHAYGLASAIMENLQKLPEDQRKRYSLPEIRSGSSTEETEKDGADASGNA